MGVAAGTLKLLVAEALVIPTGLLAAAFLTRRLGPELYGVFTVATAIVVWAELAAATLLSRTAVKLVGETDDWKPVAAHLLKLQLLVGAVVALVLMVAAPVFAMILRMPPLLVPLRILAFDIPIFALASMHKALLMGRGSYSRVAMPAAANWVVRAVLILLLVGLGLSLTGAVLASIGASLASLILMRRSLRVPWRTPPPVNGSRVWRYAPSLFLSAMSVQLFSRLDLFMVTALSAAAGVAGIYGAAQNLAIVPGLLAGSFSPLLLSTLTAAVRTGNPAQFQEIAVRSVRGCLWLLPFAAAGAAAAPEVVTLVYGSAFAASGSIATILLIGAMALLLLSVSAAVWTARGQPRRNLAFTLPLLPAAAAAHLFVIPRFGGQGAALVTAAAAWASATVAVIVVLNRSGSSIALRLLARVFTITAGIYLLARAWDMPGFMVLAELLVMAGIIVVVLWMIGEVRSLGLWFGGSRPGGEIAASFADR